MRLALHAPTLPPGADDRRFVRRCLDVDLAFGDFFRDSALLKRAVEAANASLLATATKSAPSGAVPGGDECAVCLERARDAVLAPCGHLCACYRCATRLERRGTRCPICRAPIASVVKVYS